MSITNINAGQAVVRIVGDNSDLDKALKAASNSLEYFAARWTNIGARLQAAGQMMFAPFQEAMRVFADFDDQMRRVAAVSGANGKAFAELTAQAKALGASTAFTASQVASGMSALGMMGFSPGEISGAMESVMNLSRATSTDLAEAASIAANQLRVFADFDDSRSPRPHAADQNQARIKQKRRRVQPRRPWANLLNNLGKDAHLRAVRHLARWSSPQALPL